MGWQSAGLLSLPVALFLLAAGCSVTPAAREAKYMASGKRYVAAKEYRKAAIDFRVASQNMPKDGEPLYQLGMTYLDEGDATLALEAFQKAVAVDPKHMGAQYQYAVFEVGSNNPDQVMAAREVLHQYAALHPDDAEALGSLALADAKLGDKEQARKMVYAAVATKPADLRPASIVIAFYAAHGDLDSAAEIARTIEEQFPNSPDAATLDAQVSLARHDTAGADKQISRALALKPEFAPALSLQLRRELTTNDRPDAEQTARELSKMPGQNGWSSYARMLFLERKFDEGAAEFERVLKEHNDAIEIRDEYSRMMMVAHRNKEAEAIVAGTLTKNPKDATALLQRVTLELDDGNVDGASNDIKTLLGLKALNAGLSYQESRLAAARGDKVREGDLLADALRVNPRLFTARLDLARLLSGSGKGTSALAILDGASPAEKGTAEFIFHRNMALLAANDWGQARKGIDQGLALVRSPGFLYQDGLLRAQTRDLAGARKSLEESFVAQPSNPITLTVLGDVMRAEGATAKYVAMLRDAVGKDAGSAALQDELGRQLAVLGDLNGARTAYTAARNAGDVPGADLAIATIDFQAGSLDAAKERLTKLIQGHDNAQARILLADIETRKGSPGNAVQHYLKAIELQPDNVAAMNNLADLIAANPTTNGDAMFWAQKALALAPSSPVVEDTVGWIYYRQGKYDEAVRFLQRSLETQERPLVHYHLAAALMKDGDTARGRKEYELAVTQDPNSAARSVVSPLFVGK